MAIANPEPMTMPDAGRDWASPAEPRDLGEVLAPAMAALFELGAELGDVLDDVLDESVVARIERSITGIDAVLGELLSLRAHRVTIDPVAAESSL